MSFTVLKSLEFMNLSAEIISRIPSHELIQKNMTMQIAHGHIVADTFHWTQQGSS